MFIISSESIIEFWFRVVSQWIIHSIDYLKDSFNYVIRCNCLILYYNLEIG